MFISNRYSSFSRNLISHQYLPLLCICLSLFLGLVITQSNSASTTILLILGIPSLIVVILKPLIGLYLTILLFILIGEGGPIDLWGTIKAGGITLYAIDFIAGTLLIAFFIRLLSKRSYLKNIWINKYLILITFVFLLAAVYGFLSGNPRDTILRQLSTIVLFWLLTIVTFHNINDKTTIDRFIRFLVFITFMCIFFALNTGLFNIPVFGWEGTESVMLGGEKVSRAWGLVNAVFLYPFFLHIGLAMIMVKYDELTVQQRGWLYLGIGCSVFLLIVLFYRSLIAGTLIGLLYLVIVLKGIHLRKVVKTVLLSIIIFIILFQVFDVGGFNNPLTPVIERYWEGYQPIVSSRSKPGTYRWRALEWVKAWKAVKRSPILGFGLGTPKDQLFAALPQTGFHNAFAKLIYNSGILGLVTYLFFLLVIGIRAFRMNREIPNRDLRAIHGALLATFITLVTTSTMKASLILPLGNTSIIASIFLGLALSCEQAAKTSEIDS